MASAVLPKSLQRTDSAGQLNVFLLLKRKSNDDLILISREDLPPTLRSGKLVLNQKAIIRDEERNSIEGILVYTHTDRDNCLSFKKQMLENKIHNDKVNIIANSSTGHSSSSRTRVNARCSTKIAKRPNVPPPPPSTTQKSTKSSSSNKKPAEAPPNVPNEADDYQEHDLDNYNTVDLLVLIRYQHQLLMKKIRVEQHLIVHLMHLFQEQMRMAMIFISIKQMNYLYN
ncbi:unnamed protein product [Rotaria socialis]